MVKFRCAFYNPLWLTAAVLSAAGCGKPAPPPQGASPSATAPTVDLGSESAPPTSTPGDAPASPPGDQK